MLQSLPLPSLSIVEPLIILDVKAYSQAILMQQLVSQWHENGRKQTGLTSYL